MKPKVKMLSISRETLRQLENEDMRRAGGASKSTDVTDLQTCICTNKTCSLTIFSCVGVSCVETCPG